MKSKFSDSQSRYWDGYTKDIDALDLDNLNVAERIELSFFMDKLGNLEGKTILDLGCGTGRWGLQLARHAKKVIGIDISKNSIGIANRTAEKYSLNNFRGVVGDFKESNYKNKFDMVIATNLIHHADDIEKILTCINRSLKQSGKLVVFEINPLNPLYYPFFVLIGQLRSHLTLEYWRSNIFSLKSLFKKAGFKVDKVDKWCYLPTMLYNYSLFFKKLNESLNQIPVLRAFCAFHVITCTK